MSWKVATAALIVLMFATSANSQSISPGEREMALIAGVPPGVLPTSDLENLLNARDENDQSTILFILSKAGIGVTRAATSEAMTASGSGWDMIARANGVEPGQYTPSELAKMDFNRLSN